MGLDSGEAIVSPEAVSDIGDRITVLEAVLDDVEQDLRGSPSGKDYEAAFKHLYAAAGGLRGRRLRVRALVRRAGRGRSEH